MPYTIKYDPQENIIFVEIEGKFTFNDMIPFLSDIIEIIRRENCYKIITDLRPGHLDLSVLEFHELPKHMEETAKKNDFNVRDIKRVFIANHQLRDLNFYETTAFNRGFCTRGCKDMEEAKRLIKGV